MRARAILRILGVIVMLTSLTKLPSAVMGLAMRDGTYDVYLGSFFIGALIGLLLYWPNRAVRYDLRLRDGFLIVTLTWVSASLVSALPLWLGPPHLSFADAVFEATSGLTTTGAAVMPQVFSRLSVTFSVAVAEPAASAAGASASRAVAIRVFFSSFMGSSPRGCALRPAECRDRVPWKQKPCHPSQNHLEPVSRV